MKGQQMDKTMFLTLQKYHIIYLNTGIQIP